MANTYTQINMHVVFSVSGRENLLTSNIRSDVFKYISGILNNIEQFPLAVNGYQDHVHLFFEMQPSKLLSDIVRIVKANSSRWINENKYFDKEFSWQKGYGAFSYSRSQRNEVVQYIMKQEEHHKKTSFKDEYLRILDKFEINFKEEYLFDFFD